MPTRPASPADLIPRGRSYVPRALPALIVALAVGASTAAAQGSRPRAVDFDLDDVADVVSMSSSSSTVSARHVNPDGTLGAHQSIPVSAPSRFAIGKVNADAWPDIVVSNSANPWGSVILGGPAGFGTEMVFGGFPHVVSDIGLADLNGDGAEDVVVPLQNEIGWMASDGAGHFGVYQKLYDLGKPTRDMGVADFNGDGHKDVVVLLGNTSTNVTVTDNAIAILLADATGVLGAPQIHNFPNTGTTFVSPAVSMRLFRTENGTYQVWFWGHTPKTEPPNPTDLTYPVFRYAKLNASGALSGWSSFSPSWAAGTDFWETTSYYCPGYFTSGFGWGFLMFSPARTVPPTRPGGLYCFTYPASADIQPVKPSVGGSYIVADMNGDGVGDIVFGGSDAEIMLGHEIEATWEGNRGSVYPQGKLYNLPGTDRAFSISAIPGYAIRDVLVDGISQGPITSFTFTDIDSNHTIHATFLNPTPVRMALTEVRAEPGRVSLHWYGNAPRARVERRGEETGWADLGVPREESPGLLAFDDLTVSAGRYAYRLVYEGASGDEATDETWVTVPSGYALALAGFAPNPAPGHRVAIAFSLGTAGAARLEMYDVTGRNVLAREVGGLGPGRHTLEIGGEVSLSPGVYWLRLTQAGRALTATGLILE